MAVLAFPSPDLTPDDETAIVAHATFRGGDYCCRRETMEGGRPAIALLNGKHQLRGHVIKRHGVYAILDPRGLTPCSALGSWPTSGSMADQPSSRSLPSPSPHGR